MDTRLAAIAGTLLVGVSLFVTALLTQNLATNQLFKSGSNAQVAPTGPACSDEDALFAYVEGAVKKPQNQCGPGKYRYCDGGSDQMYCSDGRELPKLEGEKCECRYIRHSTQPDWVDYFKNFCCSATSTPGQSSTNTPPPGGNTTTPACTGIPAGGDCSKPNSCCTTGFCIGGVCRTDMTPTPKVCLPVGTRLTRYGCNNPDPRFAGRNGNPCCEPLFCEKTGTKILTPTPSGNKIEYIEIQCYPPTGTPIPSPTKGFGMCGKACGGTCNQGEGVCRNKNNPRDETPDCSTGQCICMRNTNEMCDKLEGEQKETCICFNPRSCPQEDSKEICAQDCDEITGDDGCYLQVCPTPKVCEIKARWNSPGGRYQNYFGFCKNPFCPTPTPTKPAPTPDDPYWIPGGGGTDEDTIREREEELLNSNPGLTRSILNGFPSNVLSILGLQ